jgi:hypothetical protein
MRIEVSGDGFDAIVGQNRNGPGHTNRVCCAENFFQWRFLAAPVTVRAIDPRYIRHMLAVQANSN